MKVAFLVLVIAALSCRVEEVYRLSEEDIRAYAEARCAAELECCGVPADPDCVESLVSMTLKAETMLDAKLTFSRACMEDLLVYAANIGCDRRAEDSPKCRLSVGQGAEGAECRVADDGIGFYMTTCANGLQCYAGRCVDEAFSATQDAVLGEDCSAFLACATDFYCGSDSTCQLRPAAGDACTTGQKCEFSFYCNGYLDGEGSCEEQLGLGDSCDPRYEGPCGFSPNPDNDNLSARLFCIEGVCAFLGSPVCGPIQ